MRRAHCSATPRLNNSGACGKERLLLLGRSVFVLLTGLSCLHWGCFLVRCRCRHHLFHLGFVAVHRSLGLVVATIGTCQSGTAEEGCNTQYHDETKNSLHIGLLFWVGCPLDSRTLPQTLPDFPRHVKRPGSGTAAPTQKRGSVYSARTCGNTSLTQRSSCPN